MLKMVICCLGVFFAAINTTGFGSPLGASAFDTVSISADEAYEDLTPGVLHLSGHFIMHSAEWRLVAATATVYGPVDKPDKLLLQGSPAYFQISQSVAGTVEASAPRMEYVRASDTLKLSGGAVLKLDKESIHSTVIFYDIGTNNYRAGGADGVTIEVPTGN